MAGWNIFSKLFSRSEKAKTHFQRGIARAHKKDLAGAVAEYSIVIDMAHAPQDIRAMALMNRALAYSADENLDQARVDLEALLATEGAPRKVVAAAKEKLKRLQRRDRGSG